MTEQEIRKLYNETLTIAPEIKRWGSFDRAMVGVLLDEIDRMRSNAGMTLANLDGGDLETKLTDPIYSLCVMAVYWKEQAKKLQKQLKESKKQDNPKDL